MLAGLSEHFRSTVLFEETFGGETGLLRFPEDDHLAWKILLHWTMQRSEFCHSLISGDENIVFDILTRCWVLGDKYNIRRFQDMVMLALLELESYVPLDVVKYSFDNTPPNSVLRIFMAEELAVEINCTKDYKYEHLGMMDGVTGFTTKLLQAFARFKVDSEMFYYEKRTASCQALGRYMVGGQPSKVWVPA